MKNLSEAALCKPNCLGDSCDVLGPNPVSSVAALADLGLTDHEIAGYFHLLPERITRIRLRSAPEQWHARVADAAL